MELVVTKYSKYLDKLKEGRRKELEERLMTLPNKEFGIIYSDIVGKKTINPVSRSIEIKEIITTLDKFVTKV